jgi:uncharacterized protein YecT (DUF1311 family)
MWRSVLVLGLLVPIAAAAQRNAEAEKCFDSGGHGEARACLERRAADSAKEVSRAEVLAVAVLEHWDQENDYRRCSVLMLKQSQTAFIGWRKAQCDLQWSLAAGGNGAGDRRLLCEIELSKRRVAELQRAMSHLP